MVCWLVREKEGSGVNSPLNNDFFCWFFFVLFLFPKSVLLLSSIPSSCISSQPVCSVNRCTKSMHLSKSSLVMPKKDPKMPRRSLRKTRWFHVCEHSQQAAGRATKINRRQARTPSKVGDVSRTHEIILGTTIR